MIVEIVWVDSGYEFTAASEDEAWAKDLAVRTVYGRVVHQDKDTILLAMDTDDSGAGSYGMIAADSVVSMRELS